MARQHQRVGIKGEQAGVDRRDDGVEVTAGERGVARTARKQRVAAEQHRGVIEAKAHRAGGVTGSCQSVQAKPTNLNDRLVLDHVVVAFEHVGVGSSDAHLVAGVTHGGNGLNVVPVAVGLDHGAHPKPLAHLQQEIMFVGSVNEYRIARLAASHHEHVVVDWPHHHLVDLADAVAVVQGAGGWGLHVSKGRSSGWPLTGWSSRQTGLVLAAV